jgi:hypothetical protein
MAAYTLLYDAEGGVQAVDFDDDYLAFKAKPGHRACLGRGYRLFHNPGQPPFKVVCACAAKRI